MAFFTKPLLRYLSVIVRYFLRIVFQIINRQPPKLLPPIRDETLLLSATVLAARIRSQKITSVEAVTAYKRRIEDINQTINAVVSERFAEALKEAEAVDALIANGTKTAEELAKEKPFLGVPFTTKNGISVKGLPLDVGLYHRKGVLAVDDAQSVKQMKNAGAICIAITNVSQLLMYWETSNNVHGTTNNPYDCRRMPGGSSGGEGALISAAGSVIGIGSDVGGSIRIPAHACGIFGHKPTGGLIKPIGVYPPADECDLKYNTIGPLTRFAVDLMPFIKVLLSDQDISHLRLDEPVDFKKLKIYYMEDIHDNQEVLPAEPEIKNCVHKSVEYFQKTYGNRVTKVSSLSLAKKVYEIWVASITKKTKTLTQYMVADKEQLKVQTELLKCLIGQSKHTLAALIMCLVEGDMKYGCVKHKQLLDLREQLYKEFEDLLGEDGILFHPTQPTPALFHRESYLMPKNCMYTAIFNTTMMPATHVPIARTQEGLPIGVQVAALKNNDRYCLAVALELEKVFGGWVPPPSALRC